MTEIHLIRHARAQSRRSDLPDAERLLTPAGMRQAERLLRALRLLKIEYQVLWTSPLARARQTAAVLAPLAQVVVEEEKLAQDWDENFLREKILIEGQAVAVVGHEPALSRISATLLAGSAEFAESFAFKKSGLYAVSFSPEPRLRFVLTPALLKRLPCRN